MTAIAELKTVSAETREYANDASEFDRPFADDAAAVSPRRIPPDALITRTTPGVGPPDRTNTMKLLPLFAATAMATLCLVPPVSATPGLVYSLAFDEAFVIDLLRAKIRAEMI